MPNDLLIADDDLQNISIGIVTGNSSDNPFQNGASLPENKIEISHRNNKELLPMYIDGDLNDALLLSTTKVISKSQNEPILDDKGIYTGHNDLDTTDQLSNHQPYISTTAIVSTNNISSLTGCGNDENYSTEKEFFPSMIEEREVGKVPESDYFVFSSEEFSADLLQSNELERSAKHHDLLLLAQLTPLEQHESQSVEGDVDVEDSKKELSEDSDDSNMMNSVTVTVHLIKAMIGSGIFSLPLYVVKIGVIPSISFLIFAAIFSAFGLLLLFHLSSKVGRNSSIKALSAITQKKLSVYFDGVIVLKCLLVAALYVKSASESFALLIIPLVLGKKAEDIHKTLFCIGGIIVVFPLSLLTKMGKLRYTSYVGVGGIFYLVIISIVIFFATKDIPNFPDGASANTQPLEMIKEFKLLDYSAAFPGFVFPFMCHPTAFPIYNEARNNSMKRLSIVVFISVIVTLIIYVSFMLLTARSFGSFNQDFALKTYIQQFAEQKTLLAYAVILAGYLFVLILIASYPLQSLSLKASLINMLPIKENDIKKKKGMINFLLSLSLVLINLIMIVSPIKLQMFSSFVGATASPLLMAVFPTIFYLYLTKEQPWRSMKVAVLIFGIVGTIIIPFSLSSVIYGAIKG